MSKNKNYKAKTKKFRKIIILVHSNIEIICKSVNFKIIFVQKVRIIEQKVSFIKIIILPLQRYKN